MPEVIIPPDVLKELAFQSTKRLNLQLSMDEERKFWFTLGWDKAIRHIRNLQQKQLENEITVEGIEK